MNLKIYKKNVWYNYINLNFINTFNILTENEMIFKKKKIISIPEKTSHNIIKKV